MAKFLFGDIVVVDEYHIGVIVRTWENNNRYSYDVYVRNYGCIKEYDEDKIERHKVRYKAFI